MLAAISATLLLGGCGQQAAEQAVENPALGAPVPAGMVRGKVAETMNSGGYTYVLLETDDGQSWYAARQADVSVGDIVQTDAGMPMHNFTSRSLDRSFDVIYFSGALMNLSAPPTASPEPAASPARAAAPAVADATAEPFEEGKDIAWVYANKDQLAGQSISLRGKVVKYNANILGRSFLHIQDGSGSAADGNNDLIVTTSSEVTVGATVVATGNIILDKDFGAGYSYPVLMEDADVTAE